MDLQEDFLKGTHEQAALFSALADPTRLKLVKLLCRQSFPHALCVNAIARILGVSQPAVSQHLRLLKMIGLIKSERRGYHIHYYIDAEELQHCRDLILAALEAGKAPQEASRESCYPKEGPRAKVKPL